MGLIEAIGVTQYYFFWDVSYQARIIMINGIVYHSLCIFYDNKYIIILRNYDIAVNLSITVYNAYNYPGDIYLVFFAMGFFLTNSFLLPNIGPRCLQKYYLPSVFHVIFVQGFFLYLLSIIV
jgi:hypothetical protein